jgi:flavodoxin I
MALPFITGNVMNKVGIFFGTDTGNTRLIAKMIAKKLGNAIASSPLNVNRIRIEDMLIFNTLILGTPTYGEGQLPGKSTRVAAGSWEEFLPQLEKNDLDGKIVALYGLGDQEKYKDRFADGLYHLRVRLEEYGARFIGGWSTEGYNFEKSKSVIDGRFIGLVLDQSSQRLLTEARVDAWLEQIKPALLANIGAQEAVA